MSQEYFTKSEDDSFREYLESYSNRQQRELNKLYSTHGKLPIEIGEEGSSDFVLSDYIFNPKLMTPILNAYDERKQEIKKDLLVLQKKKLQLGKHIKMISEENQQNVEKIEQLSSEVEENTLAETTDEQKTNEIKNIEQQIELYEKENKLYHEECEELRNLIHHMTKEQKVLDEDSQLLPNYNSEKIRQVLIKAREKVKEVESVKNKMSGNLEKQKRKLLELKEELKNHEAELAIKEQNKDAQMQRKEMEENELLENIKLQEKDFQFVEMEKDRLTRELEEKEKLCAIHQNNELEALEKLKNEIMKVQNIQFKIKSAKALNQKRREKLDYLREISKKRVSEFSEKCNKLAERLYPTYKKRIERNQKRVSDIEVEIEELKREVEKAEQEKKKMETNFRNRLEKIRKEQTKPPEIINKLTAKVQLLSNERDEIERKTKDMNEKYRKRQLEFEQTINNFNAKIKEYSQKILINEKQICDHQVAYQGLENQVINLKDRNQKLQFQIQEREKENKDDLEKIQFDQQRKIQVLSNTVNEKEMILNEISENIQRVEDKIDHLKRDWKNGINKEIQMTTMTVNELEEENEMLKLRNNELHNRLSVLLKEKSAFTFTAEEFEEERRRLENRLRNAKERANITSKKLQHMLSKEERLLKKKKELKLELERKKLEIERMKNE